MGDESRSLADARQRHGFDVWRKYPAQGSIAVVIALTGVWLVAILLVAGGAMLALNYADVANRASRHTKRGRSWYVTPAGWRWEGALLMVLGLVLTGLGLATATGSPARPVGIGMVVFGVLLAVALITYGTIAFTRHRRSARAR